MNSNVSLRAISRTPGHPVSRGWKRWTALALVSLMAAMPLWGAEPDPVLPPPDVLKKLSVGELLDMVVTSVSKRPEKLLEAASAIQVISSEDIRRSGATSLPEALRMASNLEVMQIDSRQWAVTARGFNNLFADKMLVLIDGRSVYTPLCAGVYWDVQDTFMDDIDRIEVISGPGATQWGANAVNGVINVTTKSAQETQGTMLYGGAGSAVREAAGARYGGQLAPNLYCRVYGKYTYRSDSLRPNGAGSDDAWRTAQGGFRLDWTPQGNDALTLQGDYYDGIMGQPGPDNILAKGGNLLGRWSHQMNETDDFKLQLYYDQTHRSIPASFTQDLYTADLDFQYHFAVAASHDVVAGFGYRLVQDDIANTPAEAFLPPSVGRDFFSTFAQDDITLSPDRLHLIAGTKVEYNNYTGFEFEPSVRMVWTPDKTQTVWSAVSRAVRTPSRIDRDLYSPAVPPYRVAGGPGVVSEKLIAYEVGYRTQLSPDFALSIATFYNDYDDLRSLEPLNPPAPFPVEISSGLEGRSVGAELSADWRVTKAWRLRPGYTELRAHTEPQPGSPSRSSDRSLAHDPNHQFYLRSLWDISPAWELDGDVRYLSSISNQGVPAYTELNLRLGWRPAPGWEVSLEGRNLLDSHHPEFNVPRARREIPRSIYATTSWRF